MASVASSHRPRNLGGRRRGTGRILGATLRPGKINGGLLPPLIPLSRDLKAPVTWPLGSVRAPYEVSGRAPPRLVRVTIRLGCFGSLNFLLMGNDAVLVKMQGLSRTLWPAGPMSDILTLRVKTCTGRPVTLETLTKLEMVCSALPRESAVPPSELACHPLVLESFVASLDASKGIGLGHFFCRVLAKTWIALLIFRLKMRRSDFRVFERPFDKGYIQACSRDSLGAYGLWLTRSGPCPAAGFMFCAKKHMASSPMRRVPRPFRYSKAVASSGEPNTSWAAARLAPIWR